MVTKEIISTQKYLTFPHVSVPPTGWHSNTNAPCYLSKITSIISFKRITV